MSEPNYYLDAQLKALRPGGDRDYLVFVKGDDDPPKELTDLRAQIENLNSVVVLSFKKEPRLKDQMLLHLEMIAQSSVCGTDWDTALGKAQLELFLKSLIEEANTVRSRFIWKIGVHCFILAAIGMALLFFLSVFVGSVSGDRFFRYKTAADFLFGQQWGAVAKSFLFAMLGVAIAISLSAIMRLRSIKLEMLGRFDPYVFSPTERIAYTLLIVGTIMVLLGFDIVTIGVGSVTLNDFGTTPSLGILIGLLAGFSEPLLAGIIETSLVPKQKTVDQPDSVAPAPTKG